jgi:hypothetical protein
VTNQSALGELNNGATNESKDEISLALTSAEANARNNASIAQY